MLEKLCRNDHHQLTFITTTAPDLWQSEGTRPLSNGITENELQK